MASNTIPQEPPPPYTAAGASSSTTAPSNTTTQQQQDTSHLQIPHKTRSGIPPNVRRSMEDEARPLPSGWVRQYDSESGHQFFVDTKASPPRSIWHHPYDDETYMSTLPHTEQERIRNEHPIPSHADIQAESSADDDEHEHEDRAHPGQSGEQLSGTKKFGRKMKDKLTNSTHQEREQTRRQREEEERKTYAQHQHIRKQMARAAETGEPQLLGTDKNGKEVYIEPPSNPYGGMGMGGGLGGMGGGLGGYGGRGYGYNPYSSGLYGNPNARYLRPQQPYGRPYGYGYGGGYGLPIGLGLGGGLLMGGLLF